MSNLLGYFEQDPSKSRHYSIDVSLRCGVRSTYEKSVRTSSRRPDPVSPLFLVIEEYTDVPPTVLNRGECFTFDECRDGKAMIEGGREGKRALLAVRTVDGSWPDFPADMHMINVVLAAVKVEQDFTGHIEKLYSCSCLVSSGGHAVYPLGLGLSRAELRTASRLDPSDLSPDYSPRKHKMSKRARHVESDQRVTGYPQKTAETRPG